MHNTLKARRPNDPTSGGAILSLALSAEQACRALGGISAGTLAAWRREHGLPHIQLSRDGRVVYPVAQLREWLAAHATRIEPQQEGERQDS
jgi:Helix-turn-helix domain